MKKTIKYAFFMAFSVTTAFTVYADERADEAKKAFNQLTTQSQQLFKRWESSFLFDKLSLETTDYKTGNNRSTAKQVAEVVLKKSESDTEENKNETRKITYTFDYIITHDAAVADKDIVAHITTTNVGVKTNVEDDELKEIIFSVKNANHTADIYKNGDIHLYTAPNNDQDNEDIDIIHWRGHIDTLDKLYGTFTGTIKANKTAVQSIDELTFEGGNNEKDGFHFKTTSPINAEHNGQKTAIDSMIFKSKLTDVDGLDFPLLRASLTMKGLNADIEEGVKAQFKYYTVGFESQASSADSIDLSLTSDAAFAGDWVTQLSQGLFNLSSLKVAVSVHKMPKHMVNLLAKDFMQAVEDGYNNKESNDERFDELIEEHGEKWLAQAQKLGFGPSIHVSFDSNKGNGFLDLGANFQDAGLTRKMLEATKPTTEMLMTLFEVNGKSSLPAKLIEEAKLQMFVAMAYQKKGEAYVAQVETKDKQLLLNDVPLDLSMLLPELGNTESNTEVEAAQ